MHDDCYFEHVGMAVLMTTALVFGWIVCVIAVNLIITNDYLALPHVASHVVLF
ncbi:hypothetical protein ACFBZI_11100 [Moraxella sp. ZJ142]|uniref:hypothetical protein n=1 Tax=Moraxella marmotae TaxID=3344520 RepID=UPI0035D42B8A